MYMKLNYIYWNSLQISVLGETLVMSLAVYLHALRFTPYVLRLSAAC